VWDAAGEKAYVTGMGSNNLVVIDPTGARAGQSPTIEVGEGPTGIVLSPDGSRLFVLNKFESSISVVDVATEVETARTAFPDPSPLAIKAGRKHLYDTHGTSGLGQVSCASCHVDARMDRLAWDLGNPGGVMIGLEGQNLMGQIPLISYSTFEPFHPMKGPLLTQTLQDIIGHEPFHWRGDKFGLEDFGGVFMGLQGDDEPLVGAEMQEFEDFLATIYFAPNPFRDIDNSLKTDIELVGHFASGKWETPAGDQLPNGNPQNGLALFLPPTPCRPATARTWSGTARSSTRSRRAPSARSTWR
jgi:YVTN family beta-propeller protein